MAVNCYCLLVGQRYVFLSQVNALGAMATVAEILLEHIHGALYPDTTDLLVPKLLLVAANFTEIVQQTHDSRSLSRHTNLRIGF